MPSEKDIVERLRWAAAAAEIAEKNEMPGAGSADLIDEAADALTSTRARLERAERALADERRWSERMERHARKLLTYDGGEGSECYHAMKRYDAREALRNVLAEIAAGRAALQPVEREG